MDDSVSIFTYLYVTYLATHVLVLRQPYLCASLLVIPYIVKAVPPTENEQIIHVIRWLGLWWIMLLRFSVLETIMVVMSVPLLQMCLTSIYLLLMLIFLR
jgi:hypothetical protein